MSELASFHEFLGRMIGDFGASATPEEVLDLWRATHPIDTVFQQDVKDVQAAMHEMKAGDSGTLLEQFHDDLSRR